MFQLKLLVNLFAFLEMFFPRKLFSNNLFIALAMDWGFFFFTIMAEFLGIIPKLYKFSICQIIHASVFYITRGAPNVKYSVQKDINLVPFIYIDIFICFIYYICVSASKRTMSIWAGRFQSGLCRSDNDLDVSFDEHLLATKRSLAR